MKELTVEQKAKAYDAVKEKITLRFGSNVAEEIFSELEMSEDEKIRKALIDTINSWGVAMESPYMLGISKKDCLAWLEKQGNQPNKVSIWKHWKDGIAGNGDGIPVFLMKNGLTYSLSSCLSFECDYIELSELENLMLEKQCEKPQGKSIIEAWKDMRLEVYQQASGNRHEPNYSDDTTKMFSLNDIDEIIEKMSEQILANSAKTCKDAWSELDDYNLQCMVAKAVKDIHNGNVGRNQELIDWLKSLKNRMQSRQNACDKEKISN